MEAEKICYNTLVETCKIECFQGFIYVVYMFKTWTDIKGNGHVKTSMIGKFKFSGMALDMLPAFQIWVKL